jgi:hypothetical protein
MRDIVCVVHFALTVRRSGICASEAEAIARANEIDGANALAIIDNGCALRADVIYDTSSFQ